jgi:hypothetical protein
MNAPAGTGGKVRNLPNLLSVVRLLSVPDARTPSPGS